jgi:hypothetical protein
MKDAKSSESTLLLNIKSDMGQFSEEEEDKEVVRQ